MELSRILRIIVTLILIVAFIAVTVAAYRRNQEIKSMTTLSEATSTILTGLTSRDLVWKEKDGTTHPYIIEEDKLENIDYNRALAGENFKFQISLQLPQKKKIGPSGGNPPEKNTVCSISAPVTLFENRRAAKIEVLVWYS